MLDDAGERLRDELELHGVHVLAPGADPVMPLGSGHVLVAGPSGQDAAVRRAAAVVAAAQDAPTAWRVLPGGPATAAHLLLAARDGTWEPGRLLARLDALARECFAAAWLPSVARLEDPAPSLGQHVRSVLRSGAGYLALHQPEPGVRPVSGSAPAGRPDPDGPARGPLLVCGEDVPPAAVELAASLAGAAGVRTASGAGTAQRYGSARAVELLALPAAPSAQPTGAPCRVCGASTPAPSCGYCHVAVAAAQPAGAR